MPNDWKQMGTGRPSKPNERSTGDLPEPDKAIIESFIAGDLAGFKYVYATYRQRVMAYCMYYMPNQASAEDAFQEVFTRVYTHREQLRETKALKSWVLLITRSVCLNLLRTSKFTPDFISIDQRQEDGFEGGEALGLSVAPSEHLGSGDVLQNALQRLAPIYRDAFVLRELEGYDYEEIAEITETTVMNVKVRITRAKKRLRILLAPYYSKEQSVRRKKKCVTGPGRGRTARRSEC